MPARFSYVCTDWLRMEKKLTDQTTELCPSASSEWSFASSISMLTLRTTHGQGHARVQQNRRTSQAEENGVKEGHHARWRTHTFTGRERERERERERLRERKIVVEFGVGPGCRQQLWNVYEGPTNLSHSHSTVHARWLYHTCQCRAPTGQRTRDRSTIDTVKLHANLSRDRGSTVMVHPLIPWVLYRIIVFFFHHRYFKY